MVFFDKIFGKNVKESNLVELEAQYDVFWDWFKSNEAEFKKTIETHDRVVEDFIDIVGPKLKEINKDFNMLTGMGKDGVGELIITPDGRVRALPFIEDFISSAPSIEGWRFISCKPSTKGIGLNMGDFVLNEDTISFIPIHTEGYPDYIHLRFIIKECTPENEEELGNALFIFLDNYLGEMETMTMIDYLEVKGEESIDGELVPMSKLSDYLRYREAEFVEKYDGVKHNSDNDSYSILEGNNNNAPLIAVVNTSFLNWEQKMSYPWVVKMSIQYQGNENGMPSKSDVAVMDEIEDLFVESAGVNSVARETGSNERTLFFATRDYKNASREVQKTISLFTDKFDIDYTIYRDKYWMGLEVYTNAINNN
ncbi:DUF695 domain-containing protein [Myroides marinus]|uniref:DUF695 domain-containing protein n=1 Tax=Myroides marinus TaxID=703342 RepID=UPI002578112B|nr:DUF695 domain-containing protein [Myroides marinus]MDM1362154.1 DUF695 domain-containing protein [Myroides marinus]MDM1380420.1 DUF695 domain-containing protein [Myroides marinus]MDM1387692.1 DUF695 domain-containing protein [Myroides marinus]MDM1394904.1 DUF695 domain-containing protein [Myroides marinus]MDM1532362.1 DUF695 domain-containing protein [Myroides marinus]